MTVYKLPLVPDPQPEGGFMVTCPLLPELVTEGETVREAMNNATESGSIRKAEKLRLCQTTAAKI